MIVGRRMRIRGGLGSPARSSFSARSAGIAETLLVADLRRMMTLGPASTQGVATGLALDHPRHSGYPALMAPWGLRFGATADRRPLESPHSRLDRYHRWFGSILFERGTR